MMKNLPEFITFTGVDDLTDPSGLVELTEQYPIEWGLLFSPKNQGMGGRYPSLKTIERLVRELPLRWSAHLCGDDAKEVIRTGMSRHDYILEPFFVRAQINTADPNVNPDAIRHWAENRGLRGILQCRKAFPNVSSVDMLFDASGGRGIVPGHWPVASQSTFCGYAGGLRPKNVADAVQTIQTVASRYWIDMETGIRDDSDKFSLALCRQVCEAVYGDGARR